MKRNYADGNDFVVAVNDKNTVITTEDITTAVQIASLLSKDAIIYLFQDKHGNIYRMDKPKKILVSFHIEAETEKIEEKEAKTWTTT